MNHRIILESIASGKSLTLEESIETALLMLRDDVDDVVKAAILAALRARGERPEEIAGFAQALRMNALRVDYNEPLLDTAGTGGDGSHTINVSTAAALLAASLGVKVAKHGNRSVSSNSGSADFLEALGYDIAHGPEVAKCLLDRVGFTFLFAPRYHKAMKSVMPVRRKLGIRTIFNLVGPLANPAGARIQVLGVASRGLMGLIAEASSMLGYDRLAVVHGEPGIDEVSVSGVTSVVEVRGSRLVGSYTITPEELGLRPCSLEELRVSSPLESVERVMSVFKGAGKPCDRSFIAANAGLALYLAGLASEPREGVEVSLQAIEEGRVASFIEALKGAMARCASRYVA